MISITNILFYYAKVHDIIKMRANQAKGMKILKTNYIKYLASLLMFGTNGIVAGFISLTGTQTVMIRSGIGGLILLIIFALSCLKSKSRPGFMKSPRELWYILLSGIGMGASWMFLYEAYPRVGVGISSLLYYCGPVIVMALSPVLFGERLTLKRLFGFAAVLCGIVVVTLGDFGDGSGDIIGIVFGLMSAVTYAVMVIFNKRTNEICGIENPALQLAVSFVTASLFVILSGGLNGMTVLPGDILPLLILGVVNTGIGCWLYFTSIGGLNVQTVSVLGYLEPLAAVIFASALPGESLTLSVVIGAVLIIGGAAYSELAG